MYNKIVDPETKKKYNVNSKKGIKIIKRYLNQIGGNTINLNLNTGNKDEVEDLSITFKGFLGMGKSGCTFLVMRNSETIPLVLKISKLDIPKSNEFWIGKKMADNKISYKYYGYTILEKLKSPEMGQLLTIVNKLHLESWELIKSSKYLELILMEYAGKPWSSLIPDKPNNNYRTNSYLTEDQERNLCENIDKMHSINIVHGDLHSGNIFLKDRKTYIGDFGKSQDVSEDNIIRNYDGPTLSNYYNYPIRRTFIPTEQERVQICNKASWSCEQAVGDEVHAQYSDDIYLGSGDNGRRFQNGVYSMCSKHKRLSESDAVNELIMRELNNSGYIDKDITKEVPLLKINRTENKTENGEHYLHLYKHEIFRLEEAIIKMKLIDEFPENFIKTIYSFNQEDDLSGPLAEFLGMTSNVAKEITLEDDVYDRLFELCRSIHIHSRPSYNQIITMEKFKRNAQKK